MHHLASTSSLPFSTLFSVFLHKSQTQDAVALSQFRFKIEYEFMLNFVLHFFLSTHGHLDIMLLHLWPVFMVQFGEPVNQIC